MSFPAADAALFIWSVLERVTSERALPAPSKAPVAEGVPDSSILQAGRPGPPHSTGPGGFGGKGLFALPVLPLGVLERGASVGLPLEPPPPPVAPPEPPPEPEPTAEPGLLGAVAGYGAGTSAEGDVPGGGLPASGGSSDPEELEEVPTKQTGTPLTTPLEPGHFGGAAFAFGPSEESCPLKVAGKSQEYRYKPFEDGVWDE